MGRPPDGTGRKTESRTAVFAYIAARLADVREVDENAFYERLGLNLSRTTANKAGRAASHRRSSGFPAPETGTAPSAIRKWLIVEEADLDLEVALVRFPSASSRHEHLVPTLVEIDGIRQVIEVEGTFEVFAVVLCDGPISRKRLQAVLRERTGLDPAWLTVEHETWRPALRTWAGLARRQAARDGLLRGTANAAISAWSD